MKLIQLNCWGGKLNTSLKRFFESEQPDFVTLQEATNLRMRPGSVLAPHDEFLPLSTFPHHFFAPVFSYQYMHELADLGNAIISTHEPDSSHFEYTHNSFVKNIDSLETNDYNVRNFAHCEYSINDKKLHVITHHGYHDPHTKDGSEENTKQLEAIGKYIDGLEGAVILAGDLNLHPGSSSLKPLNERLRNLCEEFNIESTRNELAKRPGEVIDYIFASDDLNISGFQASDVLVSDHRALILEFDIG